MAPLDPAVVPINYNAVEVTVRRSSEEGYSSNGPVSLFFAPIFGQEKADASATAVAAFDDRVVSIDFGGGGAGGLPISMDENDYLVQLTGGNGLNVETSR